MIFFNFPEIYVPTLYNSKFQKNLYSNIVQPDTVDIPETDVPTFYKSTFLKFMF